MNKKITLIDKQWNYEHIRGEYNIITKHISISSYYINKEKKYNCNCKKYRESRNRYKKSKKGLQAQRKAQRKSNAKRRQKLGWVKLYENPFDESVEIEWHHVTDKYVVAIPKDLHRLYNGLKNHREIVNIIVKQIYLEE